MSKKTGGDYANNLQENETDNLSSKNKDLKISQFTNETITDKDNIFTVEGTLTAIIEDLTDLKAESKSTQKSIFFIKTRFA